MTFLAPWLLGGLALASAPIIIHLLNRRRFIVIDWAPMRYLKKTLKTNRRRLQLEQWILLAVRTLLIVLLFLAVARPMVSGTGIGAWLVSEGRTSRVLVIDDSLSMGLRVGGQTAFERATDAAAELIEQVGTQDSLTVFVTSSPDEPLIRNAAVDDAEALASRIRVLEPSDLASAWPTTLDAVQAFLDGAAFPVKEVTLITDRRAEGWSPEVASRAERFSQDGVKVRILDAGFEPSGNTSLVGLTQDDPVAMAGVPIALTARVLLEGEDQRVSDQAVLSVDGVSNPITLPPLEPGRAVEVPLSVVFEQPGSHDIKLTLPGDALAADNERCLAIDVRRGIDVLLVDGEPAAEPRDMETFFLGWSLNVGAVPYRVRRVVDSDWLGTPMGAPDLLVLANVASVPRGRADQLIEMVGAGMGLMIFVGDQVDPVAYNTDLYRDGTGVLPGELTPARAADQVRGLLIESGDDHPLKSLTALPATRLASVVPQRLMGVSLHDDAPDAGDVRVLARWNDASRSVAAVHKTLGKGQVVLFTVTADRAWSDWPTDATYVLAVRAAAVAIAGGTSAQNNLTAGESLSVRADPGRPPSRAQASVPQQDAPAAAVIDRSDPAAPVVRYAGTSRRGFYQLTWDVPGTSDAARRFAVNPEPAESDLTPLEPDRLHAMLAPLDVTLLRLGEELDLGEQDGKEFWRTAALALLAFVLIETLLAAWVGREH